MLFTYNIHKKKIYLLNVFVKEFVIRVTLLLLGELERIRGSCKSLRRRNYCFEESYLTD